MNLSCLSAKMPLDHYTIGKVIGKGSYGEVNLVKHRKDKKQYVMKKVDLSKASVRERKAAEQEAKLLSQLRHPNIVSYRESFQDEPGFLYIVMNFCEGGDLYSKLKTQAKEGKALEETQVVEWFVQIAMALQYMHERHVLHRDLKTQNIFLTKSNIIKVGDLGIARVLETSSDMATTLIGTPYYMSPELFSNQPYNHKSDVWALGCCLYEMCTLRHAFNAKDMSSLVYKILKGKIPPLPSNYSSDLCSIVQSMLELDPMKRPSAQRLLRHSYIKKQIALFLEGTKNRQKKKSVSKEERTPSAKSRALKPQTSKSDSGYSGSGLEASVATASAIDCIIDEGKPPKPSRKPSSRSDQERSSIDSASSSSGSSEKGPTEVAVKQPEEKNAVDLKQREMIKKQMAERKKVASEKASNRPSSAKKKVVEEDKSSRKSAENGKIPVLREEKRPMPKPRTPRTESQQALRPLPQPPKGGLPGGDLPASRSPRARRRYKVTSSSHAARSHYAEEEEQEDEDKSTADSETSQKSVSVSDNTPLSGLSARERRRLKQRQKNDKNAFPTPPSVPVLPSPNEVIAAKVKRSQEGLVGVTPKQGSAVDVPRRQLMAGGLDVPDGGRPILRQESSSSLADSIEPDSDTDSEMEEISPDEPNASAQGKPRRQSDVTSLISALDSTLKMSNISVDRDSPDVETVPEKDEESEPLDVPYGGSPTTSGRLRHRIDRLRSECIRGIGEDLLTEASSIIDTHPEDYVEEALVRLMGRENFERYGGPIWQLKFCESFKVT